MDHSYSFPLGQLISGIPSISLNNITKDIPIQGIALDSRRVKPGDLFVAIQGYEEDGHYYIEEALKRGAQAIVSEKEVLKKGIPLIKVQDSRKALGSLLAIFYGHPSRDLFLVGITGTNGKTTTAFMIYSILKEAGLLTGLLGTLYQDDGTSISKAHLTTPDPLELQRNLFRMRENNLHALVMEVSSQGLKQDRVFGLDFDLGIFTNLTLEHLEFHGSFSAYAQAKRKFFDLFGPHQTLLFNKDDARVVELVRGVKAYLYSFSLEGEGNFTGEILSFSRRGTKCQFFFPNGDHTRVTLNLLGRHNVYNALAAASGAYLAGVSMDTIVQALHSFQPVSRRLELKEINGFTLLDDTALNPASYEFVFESVKEMEYRNLIILNGIRGQRGTEMNRKNAKTLLKWCQFMSPKKVIITSSQDVVSSQDIVSREEEEAFRGEFLSYPYLYFKELYPSVKEALQDIQSNDLLLFLGAQGMDEGRDILQKLLFPKEGK